MKALGEMSCWEVKVGWGGEEDQSCAVTSRQLEFFCCELFRRRRKQQKKARSLELQAAYFEESEQLLKWLPNNPLAARNKWP